MIVNDIFVILPEIFLAISVLVGLLYGTFRAEKVGAAWAFALVGKFAMLTTLSTAVLLVALGQHAIVALFFNNLFVMDDLAIFGKVAVCVAAFFVLQISLSYCQKFHQDFPFEYSLLILLSLLGMMLMISANDFLTLYLGLEIQSLALYVLAAIDRRNKLASEAGVKYFVLGALASGILLYGVSFIYGFAGTTNFAALADVLSNFPSLSRGLQVGLVLVVVGLTFKISAAPMHMWAPDVYQGVPTPVTAYFAIVPKLAVAILFVRVLVGGFGAFLLQWQDIIALISALSMLVGAFAGVWQRNIKRLLAYSSIANMGYALIGVLSFASGGISAMLVFFVIYMLGSVGIFALLLSMQKADGKPVEEIADLRGLAKAQPIYAAVFALLLVSLIGLPFPPYAGFFGKFFIFEAAIAAQQYVLAVVGVLSSVVAAFYYLRIIRTIYFDEAEAGKQASVSLNPSVATALLIITLANLAIFIAPDKLVNAMPTVETKQIKFAVPATDSRI